MKIPRPPVRTRKAEQMETAIRRVIRLIPRGKIATYGQIAEAAGYPRYHRQVAQVLRKWGDGLPWHRVLGSGGQIKCTRDGGFEQRLRLEMEGVRFRGSRVDVAKHQYVFRGSSDDV
jgi:methylated-DNA-protein-cysteine methyltransferase-like protein